MPGWNGSSPKTYHNAVIPCENRQFVQARNKIPPRGSVARYKNAESEDGKWVHESNGVTFPPLLCSSRTPPRILQDASQKGKHSFKTVYTAGDRYKRAKQASSMAVSRASNATARKLTFVPEVADAPN